jgi:hypothetical protein
LLRPLQSQLYPPASAGLTQLLILPKGQEQKQGQRQEQEQGQRQRQGQEQEQEQGQRQEQEQEQGQRQEQEPVYLKVGRI